MPHLHSPPWNIGLLLKSSWNFSFWLDAQRFVSVSNKQTPILKKWTTHLSNSRGGICGVDQPLSSCPENFCWIMPTHARCFHDKIQGCWEARWESTPVPWKRELSDVDEWSRMRPTRCQASPSGGLEGGLCWMWLTPIAKINKAREDSYFSNVQVSVQRSVPVTGTWTSRILGWSICFHGDNSSHVNRWNAMNQNTKNSKDARCPPVPDRVLLRTTWRLISIPSESPTDKQLGEKVRQWECKAERAYCNSEYSNRLTVPPLWVFGATHWKIRSKHNPWGRTLLQCTFVNSKTSMRDVFDDSYVNRSSRCYPWPIRKCFTDIHWQFGWRSKNSKRDPFLTTGSSTVNFDYWNCFTSDIR